MIRILSLALLMTLIGCSHVVVKYYNDSDKVIAGSAAQGVCAAVGYDCVVMSKGTFRAITTVNSTIKTIYVVDEKTIEKPK